MTERRALTTGEVAKHCGVNLRTVIRWIERGHLKAYQLPGRGDNRVEIADFVAFLHANRMPVPAELQEGPRRVLVVEDDEQVAGILARALKEAGYEVALAEDGFQAGTLLGTLVPAVMTVDLRMSGMGGLEVIRQVRGNPRLAGVKILIVSAMPKAELEEALKAGADGILQKPFEPEALLAAVSRLAGP